MEVFLVPVGPERYELYCEVPDEPHAPPPDPARGFFARMNPGRLFARMKHRFTEMLAEAERERRHGRATVPQGWLGRMKARMMRWVAESIAEQRLLWTLRREDQAVYFYPEDMDETAAVALLRKQLGRDFDKHQFWLILDSLGFVGSGLLMLVPGPNVLAYYFAFRMVGHFFSLRGAKRGLNGIVWTNTPSRPLAELRPIINVAPGQREQRVHDIAAALGLEHFATFFQRIA